MNYTLAILVLTLFVSAELVSETEEEFITETEIELIEETEIELIEETDDEIITDSTETKIRKKRERKPFVALPPSPFITSMSIYRPFRMSDQSVSTPYYDYQLLARGASSVSFALEKSISNGYYLGLSFDLEDYASKKSTGKLNKITYKKFMIRGAKFFSNRKTYLAPYVEAGYANSDDAFYTHTVTGDHETELIAKEDNILNEKFHNLVIGSGCRLLFPLLPSFGFGINFTVNYVHKFFDEGEESIVSVPTNSFRGAVGIILFGQDRTDYKGKKR